MGNRIQLSIIIPMYNVAQYLTKCIHSVFNQGLNLDEFEVILIDDGSTDDSFVVAQKLTLGKQNVIVVTQKNKGLGGARNTGIRKASGEYLLFLDSDDWYLPNVLSSIWTIANDNQLDILEFAAQGITLEGKITYHQAQVSNKILDGIHYYNTVRYMNSACNKLYKRAFLINNDLFFLERIFIEDFEFNTRVFAQAKRVLATDFLVAQFLKSPNSITRNSDIKKKDKIIQDLLIVLQNTKKAYMNHILSNDPQIHHYFEERLGFIVVNVFYQLFKSKATFNTIKETKRSLKEQNLFYINHKVFQKDKDWFRIIMLKNFWLFKISQPLLRFIS